ncbi:MAG: GspH/FimT family pseudopilin [Xanthomonadales bacterium]|nr:GspH/FimT family pseudopilin [Xanthomonadales bacterium]
MDIHRHGTGRRLQSAVTVLELLVTLSIAGILLVTGVPSLQQFSWNQQIKAAVTGLHSDLLMARSEAVHRNLQVIACPGDPQAGCDGSSDWSAGWIVFADDSGDRQRQNGERLVRHGQGFDHLAVTGSAGRSEVRFYPDGSTPGSNGSIAFCNLGGPPSARRLIISNLGRIRRERYPGIDPARCPTG